MHDVKLAELRRTPNALAPHYSQFQVTKRLLLSGHSHQAWPDFALEGQIEAFQDAAREVDEKWGRAFGKADEVRAGLRTFLDDAQAEIALGASTHELVLRFLSALDLRRRPRIVTTAGEFHTLRRQLTRLAEAGLDIAALPVHPVETLAERLADATDDRTAAVFVSSVLFETSRIVPGLGALAERCQQRGAELVVDAYHAIGPAAFSIPGLGLSSAWVLGGGYKYLQLGEGNCFLRVPAHAESLRPVITGWYAEFDALAAQHQAGGAGTVGYGKGANRFAGATYDPTSHYRAARVFWFFEQHGLTPAFLRRVYQHQIGLLAARFDALNAPDSLVTRDRDTPLDGFGGFLSLRTARAAELQRALAARGVRTDSRAEYLRLGPAPYLSDDQIVSAVDILGEVLRQPEFSPT